MHDKKKKEEHQKLSFNVIAFYSMNRINWVGHNYIEREKDK